jgi:hypothetical protein
MPLISFSVFLWTILYFNVIIQRFWRNHFQVYHVCACDCTLGTKWTVNSWLRKWQRLNGQIADCRGCSPRYFIGFLWRVLVLVPPRLCHLDMSPDATGRRCWGIDRSDPCDRPGDRGTDENIGIEVNLICKVEELLTCPCEIPLFNLEYHQLTVPLSSLIDYHIMEMSWYSITVDYLVF